MILADANLLLYAYNVDAPEHGRARRWLENLLARPGTFALSWPTITAFIRISTSIRAFPQPLRIKEAVEIVSNWLAHPAVTVVQPTERHWAIFSRLLEQGQAAGALAMDAHLATLAIEHGCQLATTDRDFSRFDDLRIVNPLSGPA